MKIYLTIAAVALVSVVLSCKKDRFPHNGKDRGNNFPPRRVHFELYTKENFGNDNKNIFFNLFMRTERRTIFDSALAVMKVNEIPDSLHRIIIDKWVPGNDTSRLAVGFTYRIENVGISWYLEEFSAGDTVKLLKYSFK